MSKWHFYLLLKEYNNNCSHGVVANKLQYKKLASEYFSAIISVQNNLLMAAWQRKPDIEHVGIPHFFEGKFIFSKKVFDELSFDDLIYLYSDLKKLVKQRGGINYLQQYEDMENPERCLVFIDIPDLNIYHLLFNSEFQQAR